MRSLPQRLADRFARRPRAAVAAEPPRNIQVGRHGQLRLDRPRPRSRTSSLSSDRSAALGSRLGRRVHHLSNRPRSADFDRPGFAKIAANLRLPLYRGHGVDPHDRDTGRADRPAEPATVHPLLDIHPSLQRSDSPVRITTGRCRPAPVRSENPMAQHHRAPHTTKEPAIVAPSSRSHRAGRPGQPPGKYGISPGS